VAIHILDGVFTILNAMAWVETHRQQCGESLERKEVRERQVWATGIVMFQRGQERQFQNQLQRSLCLHVLTSNFKDLNLRFVRLSRPFEAT